MDILKEILANEKDMRAWQCHLHENPELSGAEDATCDMIKQMLAAWNIPYDDVENGGILGYIKGGKTGKTVLLRADVDALEIEESPDNLVGKKACVSKVAGVSHLCGHDAHTAMLLCAARVLAAHKNELAGDVVLMFERGEEKTANCIKLFRHIERKGLLIDSAFATHMYADLESGKVAINDGPVMASNFCFDVKIKGTGGHGAYPHLANNPIDCFVAVYTALQSLRMRKVSPYDPLTLTVGLVNAGKSNNIIPEEVYFRAAIRFYDKKAGEAFRVALDEILAGTTAAYGMKYEYTLRRGPCKPVVNDPDCAALARQALDRAVGEGHACTCPPQLLSETFGKASAMWPGVYALVGTKNDEKGMGAAHHNEHFEIDPDTLKLGAAAYVSYAIDFLQSNLDTAARKYKGSFADMYAEQGVPEAFVAYLKGELDDLALT